jgi:hypothetical protein
VFFLGRNTVKVLFSRFCKFALAIAGGSVGGVLFRGPNTQKVCNILGIFGILLTFAVTMKMESVVVEPTGGTYWWNLLVDPAGGTYWWNLLVEPTGGTYWWNLLVEPAGGTHWSPKAIHVEPRTGTKTHAKSPRYWLKMSWF